mmetsp:Transcript_34918/g.62398  ORF Transcript_34918/g.62398 Transcript_34918/m.62398 type:complete len:243 (+) Transcript_34918:123-851(+)
MEWFYALPKLGEVKDQMRKLDCAKKRSKRRPPSLTQESSPSKECWLVHLRMPNKFGVWGGGSHVQEVDPPAPPPGPPHVTNTERCSATFKVLQISGLEGESRATVRNPAKPLYSNGSYRCQTGIAATSICWFLSPCSLVLNPRHHPRHPARGTGRSQRPRPPWPHRSYHWGSEGSNWTHTRLGAWHWSLSNPASSPLCHFCPAGLQRPKPKHRCTNDLQVVQPSSNRCHLPWRFSSENPRTS